jgi:rod shape-determining protein MreD|tara:strand:- start:1021 stop:1503 length:483 start_codon:yes stop_codon:yes gene_type:complete
MVKNDGSGGGHVIITSILIAMVLMLIQLPESMRILRPEWVLLTLMYWAMALPLRVGVGYAWVVGLLMDVLFGGVLGVLAFSYAVVVYLILRFHLQLRQFPLWQQALSLMSLILLVHVVTASMTSGMSGWLAYFPAAVMSTLLWPLVHVFLRGVRRTFNVR